MELLMTRVIIPESDFDECLDESTDFTTLIAEIFGYPPDGTDYADLHEWMDDQDFWNDVYDFIDDDNIGKERTWYDSEGEEIFTIEILGYGTNTTGHS